MPCRLMLAPYPFRFAVPKLPGVPTRRSFSWFRKYLRIKGLPQAENTKGTRERKERDFARTCCLFLAFLRSFAT